MSSSRCSPAYWNSNGQVPDAAIQAVEIRAPEVAGILAQHGIMRVLRSFPDASPTDTVLVSEFRHRIRLIDRTQVFRFRFPANAPLGTIADTCAGGDQYAGSPRCTPTDSG